MLTLSLVTSEMWTQDEHVAKISIYSRNRTFLLGICYGHVISSQLHYKVITIVYMYTNLLNHILQAMQNWRWSCGKETNCWPTYTHETNSCPDKPEPALLAGIKVPAKLQLPTQEWLFFSQQWDLQDSSLSKVRDSPQSGRHSQIPHMSHPALPYLEGHWWLLVAAPDNPPYTSTSLSPSHGYQLGRCPWEYTWPALWHCPLERWWSSEERLGIQTGHHLSTRLVWNCSNIIWTANSN